MSHVVATRGGNRVLEQRTVAAMSGAYGTGWGWTDPSAIPPPGMGRMQRAGVLVTEKTLLQVDVVFTALRIISTAILKMGDPRAYTESLSPDNVPYRKYSKSQPDVLTDTWGGRLMQYDGRRRTIMSMGLFGEAFWYVLERDRLEYPSALDVLHPAFMEIKAATPQDVKAGRASNEGEPIYLYGTASDRKVLDPENVIHIPFMALPQARRGLSTTEYAGVAGALAMAAYEFGSTWFSQGAAPSFLLTTDAKLGQEEVERIADKFLIQHSGLSNAHLPLVLDNNLQAKPLMSSPDEAQYLHTLEYARNVLASWFGIPLTLLGNALERQTPMPAHTAEEETQRFLAYTLSGYLVPLEEAYASILPPKQKVMFDDSSLARPDAQFLAQLILNLRTSGAATINDVRTRYMGWAPIDGGDEAIAPLASNVAPSQTPTLPKQSGPAKAEAKSADRDDAFRLLLERAAAPAAPQHVTVGPINVDVPERSVTVAATRVKVDNHVAPADVTVPVENRVEVQPAEATVQVDNHVAPAEATVRVDNHVAPSEATVRVDNHVEPTPVEIRNEIDVMPSDVTVNVPTSRSRIVRDQRGRISGIEHEEE